MNLDQVIGLLLGAAFGIRALDGRRPTWARIAYGVVGFDLLRTAYRNEDLVRPTSQVGKIAAPQSSTVKRMLSEVLPPKFEPRRARNIEQRVVYIHEQIVHDTKDPKIYALAREVLNRKCGGAWCVPEKDGQAEIVAIFEKVRENIRYTFDPTDFDAFQSARKTWELRTGDCIPADALVLAGGYHLKPIGDVREGDVIMGDGQWTRVTHFWDKGKKPLLAFDLNNGCTLRCTPDHKLFVIPKERRGTSSRLSGQRSNAVEVRARDVRVGDDLLSPERLPFGAEALGVDKGWLLGAFAADGWGEEYRASISGKDGHPKAAQKRRVQEICGRLGVATRWHERYIAINDPPLARWLSACGHGALQKHIPSLDLDEVTVSAVLEGLQADSHCFKNGTRVFGTISKELALQLRILLRMQGKSTHIRRVDEHGGLGENPIYRITERVNDSHRPHPRVRAIRELPAAHVVDIETDTHRFYLPESDTIVHNCDCMIILLGAMLRSVGHQVRTRVVQTQGFQTWNHIYLLAQLPDKRWVALDPIMKDKPPGWQVPREQMVREPYDADVVEKGPAPRVPKE